MIILGVVNAFYAKWYYVSVSIFDIIILVDVPTILLQDRPSLKDYTWKDVMPKGIFI